MDFFTFSGLAAEYRMSKAQAQAGPRFWSPSMSQAAGKIHTCYFVRFHNGLYAYQSDAVPCDYSGHFFRPILGSHSDRVTGKRQRPILLNVFQELTVGLFVHSL